MVAKLPPRRDKYGGKASARTTHTTTKHPPETTRQSIREEATTTAAKHPSRDSARSLRSSFMSPLPDKVRAGLDPERLADLDLSRAKGLSQGNKTCEL